MPTFKHRHTGKEIFFAHIPRTAGRYVDANLLWRNDFEWKEIDMDTGNGVMSIVNGFEIAHYHREHYEKYLDVEGIPHFSIVRNPFKRFIGASPYIKRLYGDDIQELMEDPNYFFSMMEGFLSIRGESANWFRPMVDFIREDTKIWRFEDGFGDDFVKWLGDIIGVELKFHELEYPKQKDEHNKLDLTPKLIENLRQLYRKDIERFYPDI